MTWNDLTEREPRLVNLLWEIKKVKDEGKSSFCRNVAWFGMFDRKLENLVGWYSEIDDPMLRTSEAYDFAYRYLYHKLPKCRGCWCL